MLAPLFQNNLLTVAPAYTGNVALIINVASAYQKGTDYQYVGNVALISSVSAQTAVSFSYNGNVALVIDVHAPTVINYAVNGLGALVLGVQARTFITTTYVGHVDLIISVESHPVASLDRRYTGHINLVCEVAASVQFVQLDISGGPSGGLIAISNPSGGRQLIAIPNVKDTTLVPV